MQNTLMIMIYETEYDDENFIVINNAIKRTKILQQLTIPMQCAVFSNLNKHDSESYKKSVHFFIGSFTRELQQIPDYVEMNSWIFHEDGKATLI